MGQTKAVAITGIQKKEFAHLLKITPSRIHQCVVDGMPVEEDGSIDFDAAIEWYEQNINGSATKLRFARRRWAKGGIKTGSTTARSKSEGTRGPRSNKPSMSFADARCRREIYSARLKKLEVMEALGKVVKHEDVMIAAFNTYRAVRDQLLTLTDRV